MPWPIGGCVGASKWAACSWKEATGTIMPPFPGLMQGRPDIMHLLSAQFEFKIVRPPGNLVKPNSRGGHGHSSCVLNLFHTAECPDIATSTDISPHLIFFLSRNNQLDHRSTAPPVVPGAATGFLAVRVQQTGGRG